MLIASSVNRSPRPATTPAVNISFSASTSDVTRVISPYSEEGSRQIASEGPHAGKIAFANVELPESMVQREIQFLMQQYAQMMQAQGVDVGSMFTQDRLAAWSRRSA